MEEDKGKKIFETLVLVVFVFCAGLIFGRSIAPVSDTSKKVDMSLFWQVWDTLDRNYVEKDKVKETEKVYGATSQPFKSVEPRPRASAIGSYLSVPS